MAEGVVSARDALIGHYKAVQARIDAAAARAAKQKPVRPTHAFGAGFEAVLVGKRERDEHEELQKAAREAAEARWREALSAACVRKVRGRLRISQDVARIIDEVANKHRVTLDDVVGPSRHVLHVAARHEAMAEVWKVYGRKKSLGWLGRQFGGRDHSTAHHALRKMGLDSCPPKDPT